MKAEGIPFSLDICGKCEIYEKENSTDPDMCPDYNLRLERMVREWNQAGKTDSEYKENNANARAQSSNSQDVSLEDDLQETETSIQHSGSNNNQKMRI